MMLDTIAINLRHEEYSILEPDRFSPSAAFLNNARYSGKTIMRCFYNPTKKEKVQGYLPRLTIFKKPFGDSASAVWMKVEFSAPKLIFGNNFEELKDQDFDRVITALFNALKRMGIRTTREALMSAKISAIHYSKNILLERTTPCFIVIQALEKLDMSSKLDLTQTDFRNGGQMAKYHASNYEIAIYDKVKDLEQAKKYGEKRGEEIDYECQHDLFTGYQLPEVMRLEIRLQSKKIKSLFTTLGIKSNTVLKELFCGSFSRAVLLHYWGIITNGLYILNIDVKKSEKMIDNIRTHFPKKRVQSVLALMGFVQLCQDMGIRGARLMLRLNDGQYYRLKSDAKKLEQNTKSSQFLVLHQIRSQLKEFIPLIKEDIVNDSLLKGCSV